MEATKIPLNKNEIKKDLMKSKAMATFDHYATGKLYYNVIVNDVGNKSVYQFPIDTVEDDTIKITPVLNRTAISTIKLSSDLGNTPFAAEERGSYLWRWIDKAIDKGEFVYLYTVGQTI